LYNLSLVPQTADSLAASSRCLLYYSALQLYFVEELVQPTFQALEQCCPRTAAQGLRGCKANAAQCRAIMQQQAEQQLALPRML
jgi:hypothetical protein